MAASSRIFFTRTLNRFFTQRRRAISLGHHRPLTVTTRDQIGPIRTLSNVSFLQNGQTWTFSFRLCSTSRACWNCHTLLSRDANNVLPLFCENCSIIQPLQEDIDYFQRLTCKKSFDISSGELAIIFRDMQRKLHPDKFSTKSQQEQEFSSAQSSYINKAYNILSKPLSRGLYMIKLEGFSVEEGDSDVEPSFLMEIMEINEEIADTEDLDRIRKIKEENSVKLENHLKQLSKEFSVKNFVEARKLLMRLKYYANIDDKVKERLGTSTVV